MIVLKAIGSYLKKNKLIYMNFSIILLIFSGISFVLCVFERLFCVAGIGFILAAVTSFRKSDKYSRGLRGELITSRVLSKLNDNYYLINDAVIPGLGGNIDHIILSQKGIFALESKHYDGLIVCDRDKWCKKKGWRTYELKSASLQVKQNAIALNRFIRSKGVLNLSYKPWIEAAVVLTNPESTMKLNNPTVAVFRPEQLLPFIEDRESGNFSQKELKTISDAILRFNK